MTDRIFAMAHLADTAVLYLLIALTLMAVYLILSRFLVLRKVSESSKKIKNEMEISLLTGRYQYVETLALDQDSVEGRICSVALKHFKDHGTSGLSEVFQVMTQMEKPKLEKSLGFLATVGSNAPYIGLFGTVLGIMKSFNDLAQASSAGQNTVMAGISAALVATAAGLLVAIPSVLAFNYYQKQVKQVLSSINSLEEFFMIYVKLERDHDGSIK